MRTGRQVILGAVVAAQMVAGTTRVARAVPAVEGTWLFRSESASFFSEVAQTGGSVSFDAFAGVPVAGTLSDDGRIQASSGPPVGAIAVEFDGDVATDGSLMDLSAVVLDLASGTPAWTQPGYLGRRCACRDGNAAAGDGCDPDCQVEPCWVCRGNPSVCLPAAEGSACEDGSACTTGSLCHGGSCAGGAFTSGCIDLGGSWAVHEHVSGFGFVEERDFTRQIRQRDTVLLLRDASSPREFLGSIDPTTGALRWSRLTSLDFSGLCGPTQAYRQTFTGHAAASGVSFSATGTEALPVSRCPLALDVEQTATRLGPPPGPCTGQPDGTPCSTAGVCRTEESCQGQVCQGGAPVSCGRCERCDPVEGCSSDTTPSCAPGATALSIHDAADARRDRVAWRWRSASGHDPGALGDPLAADGLELCLFDTSGPRPAVLFAVSVPAGDECSGPCWSAVGPGASFSYRDPAATGDGATALDLRAPRASRTSARLRAAGEGLSGRPAGLGGLPLPSSLRIELRSRAGACLGADYSAATIAQNDPVKGRFWARSR